MNKIVLDINDDVVSALEKIKDIDGASIEVEIPEGAIVLDNITNLKLLERKASDFNKSLHFHTVDPVGKTLVSILNNEEEESQGFLTKRVALDDDYVEQIAGPHKRFRFIPSLSNPLSGMRFPALGKLRYLIPVLVFLVLIGGAFAYVSNSGPTATVTIVVKSQPLIKSFPIKVSAGESTSESAKVLNGNTETATVEEKASVETTGESIEGEKAKGEVTLYNKTDEELTLKKGTELRFDEDPKDLVYVTLSEVKVPAKEELPLDPDDPPGTIKAKAGEKSVDIEAAEVGSSYNIDKDETLSVKSYDDDELYAETAEDIDGGKSEKVKVVAPEDVEKLKKEMTPKILEQSEAALKKLEQGNNKFVTGSSQTAVASEQYSHKEGEKTESLELTQTGESKGLFYSKTALDDLVDSLVDQFVPEGYQLSSEEREVKVEVLGQSDSSVLSSEEADLQITLKTYVVPALNEDELKADLAGKSAEEAEQVLAGIRNIKTYGVNIDSTLPFFQKIPTNPDKIKLEIQLGE